MSLVASLLMHKTVIKKCMFVSMTFRNEGIIVRVHAKITKSFWRVFEICAN